MISTDTSANVTHNGARPEEYLEAASDARAQSLQWLGVYLAVSGVSLVLADHRGLAALHAGTVLVVGWSLFSRGRLARVVGDLLPLFVAPALYGEIPMLIAAMGTTYHDSLVQRWEVLVFGGQPSRELAGRFPISGISELLHFGYLAYYPAIFAPPLILYARRKTHEFAETVLVLTKIYLLCWVSFVLLPVEGPRYLWGTPAGVPDGAVRRLAARILAAGSSRGAAFPSSHMAVMVGQTMLALRWQRRVGYALAVMSVLVGVGAVYGGFHYAVDMVAGALLGVVCAATILRHSP